jgi:hypothetical protein
MVLLSPYPLRKCDTADEDGPRVHVRTLCLLQSQHFLPGNIHSLEGAYIEENPRTGSCFFLFLFVIISRGGEEGRI